MMAWTKSLLLCLLAAHTRACQQQIGQNSMSIQAPATTAVVLLPYRLDVCASLWRQQREGQRQRCSLLARQGFADSMLQRRMTDEGKMPPRAFLAVQNEHDVDSCGIELQCQQQRLRGCWTLSHA